MRRRVMRVEGCILRYCFGGWLIEWRIWSGWDREVTWWFGYGRRSSFEDGDVERRGLRKWKWSEVK
jgi:hypothetical protein